MSTTLTQAPWERTRVINAPATDVITDLKTTGEGDILVNSSAGIIKALLAADLLDRFYLMILPEITGGGQRLFDDGLPACRPRNGRSPTRPPASWANSPWSTPGLAEATRRGRNPLELVVATDQQVGPFLAGETRHGDLPSPDQRFAPA
ncbi:dihydrofolate reductase family protein [Actinoallomurus sp. CA-142502]|uniref:dihydrofolate reductase family protein n=1 Tax=Actinoallomurus sp. CA-142502 TaxID=3239885 RepID=UPI003D8A9A6C